MMLRIVILALTVTFIVAQSHTDVFKDYWGSNGNFNYFFFDDRTFGMDFSVGPCTPMSNDYFRDVVRKNFGCTGKWCLNRKFSCINQYDRECYNVEHIIDKNRSEYGPEATSIAGNLVMTWSGWNQDVGTTIPYPDSKNEKEIVYGADRVARAEKWVRECAGIKDYDYSTDPLTIAAIILICFVAIIVIRCLFLLWRNEREFSREPVVELASTSHTLEITEQ